MIRKENQSKNHGTEDSIEFFQTSKIVYIGRSLYGWSKKS